MTATISLRVIAFGAAFLFIGAIVIGALGVS